MSINRYQPHIFVLPEDDANRQIATGFILNVDTSQIQTLPEAGGWLHVCHEFLTNQVSGMQRFPCRHVILLIDFDSDGGRLARVQGEIPDELKCRVFVLGAWSEPEALRQAGLGSFEDIGKHLADECRVGQENAWAHELLRHNDAELQRLRAAVRDLLFGPPHAEATSNAHA